MRVILAVAMLSVLLISPAAQAIDYVETGVHEQKRFNREAPPRIEERRQHFEDMQARHKAEFEERLAAKAEDRAAFKEERRGDRQDLRDAMQNAGGREDRQQVRQDFRADRRDDRQAYRQDRQDDRQHMRQERRGERQANRAERRTARN